MDLDGWKQLAWTLGFFLRAFLIAFVLVYKVNAMAADKRCYPYQGVETIRHGDNVFFVCAGSGSVWVTK